ncbi:MAG: tetratricopeptide repeat protein [Planctomycetaceae bacterium]|nr:tetratricopeptide repeat protein [Planctomycetaceae bacterium]
MNVASPRLVPEDMSDFCCRPLCGILLGISLLLPSGCSSEKPAEDQPNTTEKTGETDGERCRKKLAAAIQRVQPGNLMLQDKPERAINGLNAWIASCAKQELEELTVPAEVITLTGESARVSARRFTVNDAAYIRDCLLLRDLTDAICRRVESEKMGTAAASDEDRVLGIYQWLVRNVSLLNDSSQRLPLSLFDVAMTGRGTAEDRAWIFAECLRQQQIDAVLLQTDAAPGESGSLEQSRWLIAVLLDDRSLVFDPALGVPVRAEMTSENSPILDLVTVTQHERWKSATVSVIAQLAAFAPRMLVLQEQLAAEDSAVLYEELTGGLSEILPLTERIATGSGKVFSVDQVAIWDYPEAQVVAANSLSESDRLEYSLMMRPFGGPYEREEFEPESMEELTTVPEELTKEERDALVQNRLMKNFEQVFRTSDDRFGKPSQGLRKARLRQLRGEDDTTVIQGFQQVRIASMETELRIRVPEQVQREFGYPPVITIPFPDIVKEVNQSTTGDSLYWSAMCQMDRGEFGTANITFMNYRRQYPDNAKWTYASLINQGRCLIQQGRTEDAVKYLKMADVEKNPERGLVTLLLSIVSQ